MTKFDWPTTGNENRLAELENDFESRKISHAYLFSGPMEVGKLTVARFFAQLLICRNQGCGECDDCKLIRANTHPNLTLVDELWIEGVNENLETIAKKTNFNQSHRTKNPKAKTDTIRIDDLREVLARVNQTSDGWKVFVIHNIERMNREAANFFLKILEEPPQNTTFLLTTSNQSLLLPTIVSRCRVMNFGNVNPTAIDAMLRVKFPNLTEEERNRVVNFSMGKPIRAQRLAENPTVFREFKEYFEKLKNLVEKPNIAEKLAFAEKVSADNLEVQKFLEALAYFLRSFMLTRAKQPVANSRYTPQKLVELIRQLNSTRKLIRGNVNPRLAVESLLLQI
ncbi:MAG: DNA polymerase III subunit delta' [Patescibacteria group bacterium]